ncbi:MAG: 3-phosphoglycerate dehydrogenase family protein [Lachnospiraceae bacterium]|nr:3-phosphoglycerate dehydrogenase family protein [Lachnospiraceae bacterium]
MYNYCCLNDISTIGTSHFTDKYAEVNEAGEADALLVRSAVIKDMEFSDRVKAIARAGAGVNNIDLSGCADQGIVVFNTPGANANGVKELVIAGMLLASRDIVGGIEWLEQQEPTDDLQKRAEKQKKKFAGSEIAGKKLGIIGLGAIGVMVANTAVALGMEVHGYDPYLSLKAAWNLSSSIKYVQDVTEIYRECDFITIHVPLNDATTGMVDSAAFSMMKEGAVLLNFARDLLVNEPALIEALESGRLRKYVTDFVTPAVAKAPNTIITPHLGASTQESEDNCAVMAVRQIRDYLENGNIKNSVNYPACDLGVCTTAGRIGINHTNEPNMLAQLTGVLGEAHVNVANIANKGRGNYAYTLIDTDSAVDEEIVRRLAAIGGVKKVRIIKA